MKELKIDGKVVGFVFKGQNGCWLGVDLNNKQMTHFEPTRKKALESLEKEFRKNFCSVDEKTANKRKTTLEKAFCKANRLSESVIAARIVEGYKTFKNCTEEEIEAMGLYIEERMGFGRNLLSMEQRVLLSKGGFL